MDNATPAVKAACRLYCDMAIDHIMKKADDQRNDKSCSAGNADRAVRLAEALRANLHRRKAQARATADFPVAPEKSDQ